MALTWKHESMKRTLCLLFLLFSNIALGMDTPVDRSVSPPVKSSTPQERWQSLKSDYQQYQQKAKALFYTQPDPRYLLPEIRTRILQELAQLVLTKELDLGNQPEALAMAQSLKAYNLSVRIDQYQRPGEYGDFNVLPQEMKYLILQWVSQGPVQNLGKILLLNKSFHTLLQSAPLSLRVTPTHNRSQISIEQLVDLFPHAISFNLSQWRIKDSELVHLQRLRQLTTLDLSRRSQITDAGLVHLQGLPHLTTLDLSWSQQITDAGLVHLQGLSSLTNLFLAGCNQITDAGLAHLQGLSSLTYLDLLGCAQITDKGKQSLKEALPRAKIL